MGLMPPRIGIRRSHGMGIILVPIMIYTFAQKFDALVSSDGAKVLVMNTAAQLMQGKHVSFLLVGLLLFTPFAAHASTPGAQGRSSACQSDVCINELMPNSVGIETGNFPDGEWVELYNNGPQTLTSKVVFVGCWWLATPN